MSTNPPASQLPQSKVLPLAKSLQGMIVEQGVAKTATFENLLGSGADLWADDAEFAAFLQLLHAARHEKG